MNIVFLDTVGLLAVWNKADHWHPAADAAYRELLQYGVRLISTPLVFWECGNAASRREFRTRVNVLRKCLSVEGLLIHPLSEEIEAAWVAFDRGDAAKAGIVDQVSFQVMHRLGITEVFSNDKHFEAAGFKLLF